MAGFGDLQEAIDTVDQERAGLEEQFGRARSVIEEQYELSETDAERSAIESLMLDLSESQATAEAQLTNQYQTARNNVLDRIEQSSGVGRGEVENVASMFEQSYQQARQEEQSAQDGSSMAGIPVWAGGGPDTGAGARIAESAGISAQAESGRNQLLTDDLGWLADTLQGESAAQRGETQRLGLQMGSAAQRDHNSQVQARIQQERMQQAQQIAASQGQFDDRRFSLGTEERGLMSTLGEMRFRAAEAEKQRQFQAAQAAAARAAARSSGGGGGGGRSSGRGGGGSSGGSGGPTAAGVQTTLDALTRRAEATATYNTSFSADAAERWNERSRATSRPVRTPDQVARARQLGGGMP